MTLPRSTSRSSPTSLRCWGGGSCAIPRTRLAGAYDEERDRDVLAGYGDERQRMEELVVAEHGRKRVRPAPRVDNRARRIGESADTEQCDRRRIEPRSEIGRASCREREERER